MEWIKRMSLKKSLFTMALVSLVIAALLSALSFWLSVQIPPQGDAIVIDGNYNIVENADPSSQIENLDILLPTLQIVLPILFFVLALLATVFLFYRWKLKEPLKILMDGANHIIENDLNFSIEVRSTDELGQLCTCLKLCVKRCWKTTGNCGVRPRSGSGSMRRFPMI